MPSDGTARGDAARAFIELALMRATARALGAAPRPHALPAPAPEPGGRPL